MTRVEVVVDNRLRLRVDDVPPDVAERLRAEFSHPNPDRAEAARIQKTIERARGRGDVRRLYGQLAAARSAPATIDTWAEADGELSLPRGGAARVRQVLGEAGLGWSWVDRRCDGRPGWRDVLPEMRVPLRAHQERLVEAGLARENCLWRSGTGSGKSVAALALASCCGLPTLVVVPTSGLLKQWVREALDKLGVEDVGVVGAGAFRLEPLTIATWQTARNRIADLAPHFGAVIFDEVQSAAAACVQYVADAFPARYRIGVSADERRKDRKECLVYDQFGPVALDVKRAELEDAGVVHDVEVRLFQTEFAPDWYLRTPPDLRSARHADLLDSMTVDDERNAAIVRVAAADVAAGRRVLALSARVEHCRRLEAMFLAVTGRAHGTGLLLGGDAENAAEFERTRRGLGDGRVRFAAGTLQACGAGVDLPSVDRGILCTPMHGNRPGFGQVRGRVCRRAEGKIDAVLHVPWDVGCHGRAPLEAMLRWNRTVRVVAPGGEVDGRRYLEGMRDG